MFWNGFEIWTFFFPFLSHKCNSITTTLKVELKSNPSSQLFFQFCITLLSLSQIQLPFNLHSHLSLAFSSYFLKKRKTESHQPNTSYFVFQWIISEPNFLARINALPSDMMSFFARKNPTTLLRARDGSMWRRVWWCRGGRTTDCAVVPRIRLTSVSGSLWREWWGRSCELSVEGDDG